MQRIKLKPDLLEMVVFGTKKATTRKGYKNYTLGPAEFYDPDNINNKVEIEITEIIYKTFKSIKTDYILCKKEGYATESSLVRELINIYGDMDDEQPMTVVTFIPKG